MEAPSALVGGLTDLHPLVAGVIATLLAAFALAASVAIGSILLPRPIRDSGEIGLVASLLIGSGLTGFAYAIMTRAGQIDAAILLVAIVGLAALVLKRATVGDMIAAVASQYSMVFRSSRLLRLVAIPVGALLWLYAIGPPRDGDVMRYHLAHVRQIISDGSWQTIADYHYAFPFGWTLNYLPFERLHLPQAAGLVNVGLWLLVVAGLLRLSRRARSPRIAALFVAAFFVHPFVIRTFATAMADAYAIFVVYAIALMLLELEEARGSRAALFGFVCWIGAQSRYQLIAWGLAVTVIFAFHAVRHSSWRDLRRFFIGAISAAILAGPFYIANLRGLKNPVWPLLVPEINGTASYADRVAAAYTATMTGSHDPAQLIQRAWELFSTPPLLPLALILVLIALAALVASDVRYRRVAILGTLFLVLWVAMEPRLFPRHVLLLLPLGPLLCVPLLDRFTRWPRAVRVTQQLLAVAIIGMVAVSAAVSWDYVRYALTGDAARYHRFTWYYPVYEWVNRNTPPDARLLVITYSGHSYYLDRPYRRADPWLSGVVDWSRISSPEDLKSVLRHGGYRYVIYDDRDWRTFYGGELMSLAIKSAVARGILVPVRASREKLYSSRTMRDFSESDVYVFAVKDGV